MRDELCTLFYQSVTEEFRELILARVRRRETAAEMEDSDSSSSRSSSDDSGSSSNSSNNSSTDSREEEEQELACLLDHMNQVISLPCVVRGSLQIAL